MQINKDIIFIGVKIKLHDKLKHYLTNKSQTELSCFYRLLELLKQKYPDATDFNFIEQGIRCNIDNISNMESYIYNHKNKQLLVDLLNGIDTGINYRMDNTNENLERLIVENTALTVEIGNTVCAIREELNTKKTMTFRYYQKAADNAMFNELQTSNKCLVKMFCGSGKSLLMRQCQAVQNLLLLVYVFPSLSLIDQFYTDYLSDKKDITRKISSDDGSTTDPEQIRQFLSCSFNKIICITYQSFEVLLDNLGEMKINVCCFDEAHHAVGETYQKLIFENDACEKQIFFTATPKNANGIIMYDRKTPESGMCGKLVYDYSYLKGVFDDYLNPFEIRIDMYTENTNLSCYETIARGILTTGNSRVLTFHSDVNTGRDTSVNNFVNEAKFRNIFRFIQETEFPNKKIYKLKNIKMIGFTSSKSVEERRKELKNLDETPDDKVFIISSCETLGEGIDTKKANMCVFVDPKSSYVKIIQNIGRIVRKVFGENRENSTILIPCWIDKTKYLECEGDKEKCDEVIRQDMNDTTNGNFNGILNVLSALKQEDEDIYDICLHYPDSFSPQEIRGNLDRQGYAIQDQVGDLCETMEYLLDTDICFDEEEYETDEDMIMRVAEENDVCVEIHTDSLENPIEKYNGTSEDIIRLYKTEEEDETCYQPIIEKRGTKKGKGTVSAPDRSKKMNINVHTNDDIRVLWKITGDITKDICSCVIDCEVVDIWVEKFEELKRFIDENERTPSQISKNETENKLGHWLSNYQQNYKNKNNNMKNEERYNQWTNFLEEYKEYLKNYDEIWDNNLKELKNYIFTNGKRPSSKSENESIKYIGEWLLTQQRIYKNKTMILERYNQWSNFLEEYKEYFKTDHEKWNELFIQLKKFISENKRTPSTISTDETEKKIGCWLSNQNSHYKKKINGMKDKERYIRWTNFLEEYKEYIKKSTDEIWNDKFIQLTEFISENKRIPSQGSTDKTEKTISSWLSNQLQNYKNKTGGMNDKERNNQWTNFLEEYKDYFELWNENFNNLKKFIDENGNRPQVNCDNEQSKLSSWVSGQQTSYNRNEMTQERSLLWSNLLEEYKKYFKTNDEVWNEKFEELKRFIDENNRMPSQCSKNKTEQKIGNWLSIQQQNYKNKRKSMNNSFNCQIWEGFLEKYKQYFKTDYEVWNNNYIQLKKFIDENGQAPSINKKNLEEEKLNTWLAAQRISYKNNKMTENMYQQWTILREKYINYIGDLDDVWDNNLKELKNYIFTNGKRPSSKSENKSIEYLGSWLGKQQKYYKNKTMGMKNEERYQQWTEFLEEYKDIFKPIKKKSMKLQTAPAVIATTEIIESTSVKRERVKSQLSVLHQEYKTLKSVNLSNKFTENPELWHAYHEIAEENEQSFPEDDIPRNRIIKELDMIRTKRSKQVIDMGCGRAQIAQHYQGDPRFNFTNYDHVSSNEHVIQCDISNIPLGEDSVEICILSLAMWGSNCEEYIKESNRILETGGKLYIIEPTKRWSERDERENILEGKEASRMIKLLEECGFQITKRSIEKFCLFECIKI